MGKILSKLHEIKTQEPIDYAGDMEKIREKRPVSYSSLKNFIKSPWHFHEYYYGEKKTSTSFDIGNTFELMLLQPELVDEQIVIMPEWNLRTKDGREQKEHFIKQNEGKLIVKESELDTSYAMYKRAVNDEKLMELINQKTKVQQTLFWKDPKTKIKNVSKLDMVTDPNQSDFAIVDLKTGISADINEWNRAVLNFQYWLQVGSYTLSYRYNYYEFPDFYWAVVENKPPYAINIIKADAKLIEFSQNTYLNLLKALKYCYDHNLWHQSHSFWHFMRPYDILEKSNWIKTKI